ncbi:MAG TPA: redoxin domain-containing protein [Thermoanaerobaculia bacterium]|nr:redoxin domain-containing protein [Thermoanaerobaculia bacterium]
MIVDPEKSLRRVRRSIALALAAALLPLGQTVAYAQATAPAESPEVEQQLENGRQLLARHSARTAIDAFRKANKLARGHSTGALVGLASAYLQMGDARQAIDYAHQALASAPADTAGPEQRELAVTAANLLGIALMKKAQGGGGESRARAPLEEAERAFRQALALSGGESGPARFNLGRALLWLSRDEEGMAVLRDYLAQQPEGEDAERAKLWIENPRRARERYAPAFMLETLDGDHLSLADLQGKITLLDFWATWCGPCVASVPSLKKISAQMAGEPFTMISVSADSNYKQLRDFVAGHKTTWTQCWDGNGHVRGQFGVSGLPTFLLLDPEGKVLFARTGWGNRLEGDLLSEIRKAVKSLRATGKSSS